MSEYLFDSSVLLDIASADPVWAGWSEAQFLDATARRPICINPLIYAEIAHAFDSVRDLNAWLTPNLVRRLPLPYGAAWSAAQAFLKYRQRGGIRTSPLPDFYIGAHAEVEGLTLVTRDAARFRTYFPAVTLISPDSAS